VSGPVDIGPARTPDAAPAPQVQWAPAVFATCIGLPLLALSLLMGLLSVALVHSALACPPGVVCLWPSRNDRLVHLAVFLVPQVLGLTMLLFTWRHSLRGQRLASWVLASGTILAGVLSLVPVGF
jgi:hypothetical protein